MKDLIIGALFGAIIVASLAEGVEERSHHRFMVNAVASGFIVHEHKAYRVTPVEPLPSAEKCVERSEPVTIDGQTFPGDCMVKGSY